MAHIRVMTIADYDKVYDLWLHTPGMGLNVTDDSREGIKKVALVVFSTNEIGNEFWEKRGFVVREDLVYRNKNIHELERIDT